MPNSERNNIVVNLLFMTSTLVILLTTWEFNHLDKIFNQFKNKSKERSRPFSTNAYIFFSAYCLLLTAYCLLLTAYCLLFTVYRLPLTVYCLLLTAYCLLPTAYCLLPTAYCLLLTAYCLLLTAYCLLLTAYCLLPTAYCFYIPPFRFLNTQSAQSIKNIRT